MTSRELEDSSTTSTEHAFYRRKGDHWTGWYQSKQLTRPRKARDTLTGLIIQLEGQKIAPLNMAKLVIELPVIAKEPIRNFTMGQGRVIPRREFDGIVRVKGNNKTEPNVCDTTVGCTGGCHGCYAARSMAVQMGRRKFMFQYIKMWCPKWLCTTF